MPIILAATMNGQGDNNNNNADLPTTNNNNKTMCSIPRKSRIVAVVVMAAVLAAVVVGAAVGASRRRGRRDGNNNGAPAASSSSSSLRLGTGDNDTTRTLYKTTTPMMLTLCHLSCPNAPRFCYGLQVRMRRAKQQRRNLPNPSSSRRTPSSVPKTSKSVPTVPLLDVTPTMIAPFVPEAFLTAATVVLAAKKEVPFAP
jgi:hypothetical protein